MILKCTVKLNKKIHYSGNLDTVLKDIIVTSKTFFEILFFMIPMNIAFCRLYIYQEIENSDVMKNYWK